MTATAPEAPPVPTRCARCNFAWPNPDGCSVCNPEGYVEQIESLKRDLEAAKDALDSESHDLAVEQEDHTNTKSELEEARKERDQAQAALAELQAKVRTIIADIDQATASTRACYFKLKEAAGNESCAACDPSFTCFDGSAPCRKEESGG